MPRIKGIPGPYRLFFTSFDCNQPAHVHVERENSTCKFWLEPIELARSHGFSARELNVYPPPAHQRPSRNDTRGMA